jgi:hypothetical protein
MRCILESARDECDAELIEADFLSGCLQQNLALAAKRAMPIRVEFTAFGSPCLGLNGGPAFRHSEAFSFQIPTDS